MVEVQAWEQMPNETSKAFRAFQVYLGLIDHANPVKQTRSVKRVVQVMNINPKSISGVELWCQKYNWVQRAAAYDNHMANKIVVYREVELSEYQAAVIGSLTQQLLIMDDIMNKSLLKLQEEVNSKQFVDPMHIKRMVEALKEKDNLARRIGKMPTSYIREMAEEENDDEYTYVIGGTSD